MEGTEGADVRNVVIAGAGQAGYQTAASLRRGGFSGRVVLIGDEAEPPYQRPPLSKGYLAGSVGRDAVLLGGRDPDDGGPEPRIGERIAAIDRARRCVRLLSGETVDYDHAVLALGSRTRDLDVPGADLAGVRSLRTIGDADALRRALSAARRVVVIGAGFIGLEFAVVARDAGAEVTVVEARDTVLPRVVSEPTADFFLRWHRSRGVRMVLGSGVSRFVGSGGTVTAVETESGERIPADLVVTGVGVSPNVELAREAGLAVDNGIVVDEMLRTEDPAISAIGDCARFPSSFSGRPVRVESVQNAIDQARCVAGRLCGTPESYTAVPWFWSDQGPTKLQIAGLADDHDRTVVRGDREQGRFTTFCFRDGALVGAESVGRAVEHVAVRRILAAKASLSPEQAADVDFDLKEYGKRCA